MDVVSNANPVWHSGAKESAGKCTQKGFHLRILPAPGIGTPETVNRLSASHRRQPCVFLAGQHRKLGGSEETTVRL